MTARSITRGVTGWLFGHSVTVLLISVWGRAVVVDTASLGQALAPLSRTVVVSERFANWMADGLSDAGVAPAVAAVAVDELLAGSAVTEAMDELVVEIVEAAATVDVRPALVDVAGVLQPAVPEIAETLISTGVPITPEEVSRMVAALDPLMIRDEGAGPLIGPGSAIAARLGIAAVLALVGMVATGGVAVRSAPDPIAEVKSLLMRVSLGGLSFGVLLRIGSWVMDPGGGRAPLGEALSGLAGAKWLTPVMVALVSALTTAVIWAGRRWLRPGAVLPLPVEAATPQQEPLPSQRGLG